MHAFHIFWCRRYITRKGAGGSNLSVSFGYIWPLESYCTCLGISSLSRAITAYGDSMAAFIKLLHNSPWLHIWRHILCSLEIRLRVRGYDWSWCWGLNSSLVQNFMVEFIVKIMVTVWIELWIRINIRVIGLGLLLMLWLA